MIPVSLFRLYDLSGHLVGWDIPYVDIVTIWNEQIVDVLIRFSPSPLLPSLRLPSFLTSLQIEGVGVLASVEAGKEGTSPIRTQLATRHFHVRNFTLTKTSTTPTYAT